MPSPSPSPVILGRVDGNRDLTVDVDKLITSKLLLCANSGGGKSWTLRRLLESTFGQVPHHVFDPEGEFHTLRDAGFAYILAGKGYDCPTDPAHAPQLARKMLELGASVVLDLYELDRQRRIDFVAGYLQGLIDAPKTLWQRALIVIDEAHAFAPEKGEEDGHDVRACRSAVTALMSLGRKRGFCGVLATQRLAKLSKSASADANNVLIGRTRQDVDSDRALKALGSSLKNQVLRQALRNLTPGRFYASGPALGDEVCAVEVGPVRSHHPEAGAQKAPASPPPAAIKAALAQLADLPRQAEEEARTIEDLRIRIRELEAVSGWRLEDRTALEAKVPELERAVAERDDRIRELEAQPPGVDAGAVEAALRKAVRHARTAVGHELEKAAGILAGLTSTLDLLADEAAEVALQNLEESTRPITSTTARGHNSEPRNDHVKHSDVAPLEPIRPVLPIRKSSEARAARGAGDPVEVTGPMHRVLNAIAWFEAMGINRPSRVQVAFVAGYSPTSTSFTNPVSACNGRGLLRYPTSGDLELTDAGRRGRNPPRVAPGKRAETFQQAVLAKLSGPQRRVLTPLLALRGRAMGREVLAERAGYSATSTSFTNPLSNLHTLGLVTYPTRGEVAGAAILFAEGR